MCMALSTNGCWLSKYLIYIYITQLRNSWKFHFAMTLCHVKSIAWLFWWTLFLNEWKKDINGWNIACIFNCTSILIIIVYPLPTYYLPTHQLIIIYTLCTCYLFTIVAYTYILHTTYLGTYRLLTYIT